MRGRSLGSQLTGDLVINPVVGCRYFLARPWLPSQDQVILLGDRVTQVVLSQDSNPQPVNGKSDALPTAPSHHLIMILIIATVVVIIITSNATSITELRSASARMFPGTWCPLVSVITTLYCVARIFHCRVWYRMLSLHYACVRSSESSSSTRLPLCQILFLSRSPLLS